VYTQFGENTLQKDALEAALKELQLKHGKTSIMRGSDIDKEPM